MDAPAAAASSSSLAAILPPADLALLQQAEADAQRQRAEDLEALGQLIAEKRKEAIEGRAASGIEHDWRQDEEHYAGMDDANRHEYGESASKPTAAGTTARLPRGAARHRSTVFPNITAPYVDAAAARIGDMLLPTDDRTFAIEPTPLPELIGQLPVWEQGQGGAVVGGMAEQAGFEPAAPGASAMPGGAGMPGAAVLAMPSLPGGASPAGGQPSGAGLPSLPGTPGLGSPGASAGAMPAPSPDAALQAATTQARTAALAAQTQIDDWLTQCRWHAEVRAALDDSARLGSGVMKGPFPVKRKTRAWMQQATEALPGAAGQPVLVEQEALMPASRRISPWNFYPDPACGEDIHAGSYTFEVDTLSEPGLLALKGLPGYIDSQIDAVIAEGPATFTAAGRSDGGERAGVPGNGGSRRGQWQIWYFHGLVKRADLEAAGCTCEEEGAEAAEDDEAARTAWLNESVHAVLTLVNDRVVRAALNPLDDGAFPYDVLPWKRREGLPWGVGVARQIRTAQRIVTAATRNLMDNAGLAAGPQLVLRRGVKPADGVRQVSPLKFWIADEDNEGRPVDEQFKAIVIPMLEGPLMSIIQMGMKMAEDTTGLPMLLQGQQGKAPDTVGGMTILNNNGTAVLRRNARLFDSHLTEPHIGRYYQWLLLYGDNQAAKGDAQVVARGSSALVERDLQSQEMQEILKMSLNPVFGWSPRRAAAEYLKSRRFDPAQFAMTPEDMAALKANAPPPPPPPPQVEAANIRAQADAAKTDKLVQRDLQVAQINAQQRAQEALADQQWKARQAAVEQQQNAIDNDLAYKTLQAHIDTSLREIAARTGMSLDQARAKLADTTLKLNTQVALARDPGSGTGFGPLPRTPQVAVPAIEPVGRAPDGMAFQR